MSLQPLMPLWLFLPVIGGLAALSVWQLLATGTNRLGWIRRTLIVVLLGVIGVGPSVEERVPDALISNAEVYFVVDRTGSMAAQDYGEDGETRLSGVTADIDQLTRVIPAAQYSIIAFDSQASSQLPLTTDSRAVRAWASTIRQEITNYSAGSSVDRPLDMLESVLSKASERNPQNVRLVFLFTDGENTRGSASNPEEIESYARIAPLVDGGAVLGYGTPEGGQMLRYTGAGEPVEGDWIIDPNTQQPALSKLDETQLRSVADDLAVTYLHRTEPSSMQKLIDGIKLSDAETDGRKDAIVYRGIFWMIGLALAAVLAWEGWDLLRQVPGRRGTTRGSDDPLNPNPTAKSDSAPSTGSEEPTTVGSNLSPTAYFDLPVNSEAGAQR